MSHARDASTSAPEAWWNDETLRDWIERNERERPQHTALLGTDSSLSYFELNTRVRALAQVLRSLGLRRGDVIAAQLPNIPEFVLTYLAASYVGAVLQTLHMPYRGAEVEPLLRYSGARAFVCVTAAKDYRPAEFALSVTIRQQALSRFRARTPKAPTTSNVREPPIPFFCCSPRGPWPPPRGCLFPIASSSPMRG